MATSKQLVTLIKSFFSNDLNQVKTSILQIAAHEARKGHTVLANELKELAVKNASNALRHVGRNGINPYIIEADSKGYKLKDLVLSDKLFEKINRIVLEYAQRGKLNKFGYQNRRKIMLEGKPGTGKTMTASVLADELSLPFHVIQTDKLVAKFMGETSMRLRLIFDTIQDSPGVYFFDEFDTIGTTRDSNNDVGEMHRVLNSFLQFIEQDESDSIIITATNNRTALDNALFRRFDDVLEYDLPSIDEIKKLFKLKMNLFCDNKILLSKELLDGSYGLSHADITKACEDTIKSMILSGDKEICLKYLIESLKDRKVAQR